MKKIIPVSIPLCRVIGANEDHSASFENSVFHFGDSVLQGVSGCVGKSRVFSMKDLKVKETDNYDRTIVVKTASGKWRFGVLDGVTVTETGRVTEVLDNLVRKAETLELKSFNGGLSFNNSNEFVACYLMADICERQNMVTSPELEGYPPLTPEKLNHIKSLFHSELKDSVILKGYKQPKLFQKEDRHFSKAAVNQLQCLQDIVSFMDTCMDNHALAHMVTIPGRDSVYTKDTPLDAGDYVILGSDGLMDVFGPDQFRRVITAFGEDLEGAANFMVDTSCRYFKEKDDMFFCGERSPYIGNDFKADFSQPPYSFTVSLPGNGEELALSCPPKRDDLSLTMFKVQRDNLELRVAWAGDCEAIVLKKNGENVFANTPNNFALIWRNRMCKEIDEILTHDVLDPVEKIHSRMLACSSGYNA